MLSVWETVLFYLVAPLGIMVVLAIWGMTSQIVKHRRYTLGQKWTGGPVWWAAVDESLWQHHGHGAAIEGGASGGAASGKW